VIDLSVYNPTGSGSVHTDRVISGGRGKVAASNPFAKKAAAKKMPAKKMPAKKAPPFAKAGTKAYSDSPGSMDGGKGTAKGIGAAKKPAKKATPRMKAMGEVPKATMSTPRQQKAATPGKRTNRVTGGQAMC
jgi:hypothetical protein